MNPCNYVSLHPLPSENNWEVESVSDYSKFHTKRLIFSPEQDLSTTFNEVRSSLK